MRRCLSVHKSIWPLQHPFRITGHVFDSLEAVCVELGENGKSGRGEGVSVYYLGETIDSLVADIEKVRSEIERGASRVDLQELMPPGGARNAVDCAYWDLECQSSGKSIWELTGIEPKPTQTLYTISIENQIADMAAKAARAVDYPILKIKLDGHMPYERVEAIRAVRPDARLVIDANQGFTFEQLLELLPKLKALNVEMVEQPLARGGDAMLDGVISPVPLCADESCLYRDDLQTVLPRYDMINIKLDKTGGLTEALALARAARAAGKRVMVGNMLGTSLSMAPALVVAQLCDFVDLDGPLSLTSDYLGGLQYSGSNIKAARHGFWGDYTQPQKWEVSR